MRAIAAHVHECCKKQECAENEAEHRDQHGVDRHQYDAADQQARIDRLLILSLRLAVERFQKAGRVLIAGNKASGDFEYAGGAHQQNGKARPGLGPELTRSRGIHDRAGINVQRDSDGEAHRVGYDRAKQRLVHDYTGAPTSVRGNRLLHVVELLIYESRSFRCILEAVRVSVLFLEEFLVFRRLVNLGERIRQFLHDIRRSAGTHDDRTKLRKCDLVAKLKGRRHILEGRQAFFAKQQDRAHLLSIQKLGDVAGLLIKRISMAAEDRNIPLAWLGKRHLHYLDAGAVKHRQREIINTAKAEGRYFQLAGIPFGRLFKVSRGFDFA